MTVRQGDKYPSHALGYDLREGLGNSRNSRRDQARDAMVFGFRGEPCQQLGTFVAAKEYLLGLAVRTLASERACVLVDDRDPRSCGAMKANPSWASSGALPAGVPTVSPIHQSGRANRLMLAANGRSPQADLVALR